MASRRNNLALNLTQALIWACVLLLPALLNGLITGEASGILKIFKATVMLMLPLMGIYWINYLWLIPRFLYRGRKAAFYLLNLAILLLLNVRSFFPGSIPEEVLDQVPFSESEIWGIYGVFWLLVLTIQALFILLAVGVRQIRRNHELQLKFEEEKRKGTEAELTWLKSQLNPHFLFNTLNNISSLTQIDPDRAQESIGQLSDLLRYALYESNADFVPLSGEISFMKDYISLMQLRCNEMTSVRTAFEVTDTGARIAPLLFIVLIENAFKHGVNARFPSFVDVQMTRDGKDLVFSCRNSVFGKSGTDHIGSGIGIENLQRRLELLYPDAFDYGSQNDGQTYTARVTLKGILS